MNKQTLLIFSHSWWSLCSHVSFRGSISLSGLQKLEPVFKHSPFEPFKHMEPFPCFTRLLAAVPLQFQKLPLAKHGRSCRSWETRQQWAVVLIQWILESQRLNEVLWCVIIITNGYLLRVHYSAGIYCVLHSLAVNNICNTAQFFDQLNELSVKNFKNHLYYK